MSAPPIAAEKIDAFGIDAVCEAITSGKSQTALAGELGVSETALRAWLAADLARSARANDARRASARIWDERAEQVITEAKTKIGVAKAKELAHHYRWRASKIAPKEYGDKLEIAGEIGLRNIPDDGIESRIAILLRATGIAGPAGGEGEARIEAEDRDFLSGPGEAET